MNCKESASIRMRGHKRVQMKENGPKNFFNELQLCDIRYGLLFAMWSEQNEHALGKGKVAKEKLCRERRNGGDANANADERQSRWNT